MKLKELLSSIDYKEVRGDIILDIKSISQKTDE